MRQTAKRQGPQRPARVCGLYLFLFTYKRIYLIADQDQQRCKSVALWKKPSGEAKSSTERACAFWLAKKCDSDSKAPVYIISADIQVTQVWQIRLDVHFVNDEGNLLDCASVACVAALRHFRKPEVSIEGTEVTIVSFKCFQITLFRR